MADERLQTFLGGSVSSTLVRLVFLSILVGALMAFFDVTPFGLVDALVNFLRRIFGGGLEAMREVLRWLIYGAIVVIPLWLIGRLLRKRA